MGKTSNDDRSESKNPTSAAHKATLDNKSRQIQQHSAASSGSQQKDGPGDGGGIKSKVGKPAAKK